MKKLLATPSNTNMKHILSILAFSILACSCSGQDFKGQFDQLFQQGDTIKLVELLSKWEKRDGENPELFTSYFNFYFIKSRQEVLYMSTERPKGDGFSLVDSLGEIAGYLGDEIIYNREILQKGFDKIDEGIKLYPNRLDMRFGKIYTLGLIEDWESFTKEIVEAVKYSEKNNNEWTWTYNEKRDDGKDFFLSSIQDYQLTLYETENDDLFANMRTIANEILKIYPDHIVSLSNISITYLLTGEYDRGIEALLKAEKIDPKDGVVLSNIAHGFKLKGDLDNSVKYYEKMLNLDDPEAVEFARYQLEQLKNK
jgi:tetratricopeptide (TPR) repeat protein